MHVHIVHKEQQVLSSLHQEEKPPEPILCTFEVKKNKNGQGC